MSTSSYYERVADRMLPFLTGRKLAIEQRFKPEEPPVYRRHEGRGDERHWISITSSADIVRWAKQRAVAFHAHLKPEGSGAWFFLDIDSRDLSLEMAQIGAIHVLDVIERAGLHALVKFSGSDGFHLMWEMPSLQRLGRLDLWTFERSIVEAISVQVERRLNDDPRAQPIRDAVGPDAPLVTTNSQIEAASQRGALLFDKLILKPNANARVPYSLHPASGLVSSPLSREELEGFTAALAEPDRVVADLREWTLPVVEIGTIKEALAHWT